MPASGPNSGPTAIAPTIRIALSSTTPQAAIIVASGQEREVGDRERRLLVGGVRQVLPQHRVRALARRLVLRPVGPLGQRQVDVLDGDRTGLVEVRLPQPGRAVRRPPRARRRTSPRRPAGSRAAPRQHDQMGGADRLLDAAGPPRRYGRPGRSGADAARRSQPPGQSLRRRQPLHLVVRALAQHQGGAAAGGRDVLQQVGLVDGAPDRAGVVEGLLLGDLGVLAEVRGRVLEGGLAQLAEAVEVPASRCPRCGRRRTR